MKKLEQLRDTGKAYVLASSFEYGTAGYVLFYGSKNGCDTFFSWPGYIRVGGKRIKGFVTLTDSGEDLVFTRNNF